MIRTRITKLAIAAALALLMPVESAHCPFMGCKEHPAPTPSETAASRECCVSPGAVTSGHASTSDRPDRDACPWGCACFRLPSAIPASAIELVAAPIPTTALIVFGNTRIVFIPTITIRRVPALDVGRPSLPDDPGAHGRRAPPVSA